MRFIYSIDANFESVQRLHIFMGHKTDVQEKFKLIYKITTAALTQSSCLLFISKICVIIQNKSI